jgi:hypothetical protein
MSKYLVKEHRVEAERGGEVKFFLLGWDVLETGISEADTDARRAVNNSPLPEDEARTMAATLEWMHHLDRWMTTLVEDEDVIEEVGDLLGIEPDMTSDDDEKIEKEYDRMIVGGLELLPAALRLLADKYEAEWRNKHGQEIAAV